MLRAKSFRLLPPFVAWLVLAACSSSSSSSGGDPGAPGGAGSGPSSGDDGRGPSRDDPPNAPPTDGGLAGAKADGASGDASVPVQAKTAVRLDGASSVCDVIATPSGTFFSTTTAVRRVVDASLGTSSVVTTLPSATGCVTLAATPSTLYLARRAGAQGELYSAPIGGGVAELVGAIPASTPSSTESVYPIVTDGTDVFVSAAPNVWHLPATGGSLTRLMVGQYNFYAQDLAIGPAALYTWHGGSNFTISRFPKTGGAATTKSSVPARHGAFVVAGDALFSVWHYPTTTSIHRVALDFQSAPAPFIPTAATALATDGTALYVATVPPTPQGSAIRSKEIGVYSPSTGARLAAFGATVAAASAPNVTYAAEFDAPMAVDATHVFVSVSGALVAIPK
jgi:hypothetical protein